MASGKVSPYNADVVSRNATYLENLAQMPWDGFHESTKDEKNTSALPAIWSQQGEVRRLAQRLQTETAKLGAGRAREGRSRREAAVRRGRQGLRRLPRKLPRRSSKPPCCDEAPPLAGLFFLWLAVAPGFAQGDAKRGEYLAKAGGCLGCHTVSRRKEARTRRSPSPAAAR